MKTGVILIFAALAGAQTMRSVWDGVYTADQAKRGSQVYAEECASCHGPELTGGESAPPLVGAGFLSNWTTLTVGDLFERVRVTMPDSDPGSLTRVEVADVIAYLLKSNRFPDGKAELDRQTVALKQIRIDAEAPKK
jgi:mono/diheme cytochrome c family protein